MHASRSTVFAVAVLAVITSQANAATNWTIHEGNTRIAFEAGRLDELGLTIIAVGGEEDGQAVTALTLPIAVTSDLVIADEDGVFLGFSSGQVLHAQGVIVSDRQRAQALGDFAVRPRNIGTAQRFIIEDAARSGGGLEVGTAKIGFDRIARKLLIESADVAISAEFAEAMGRPQLAGEVIGSLRINADLVWTGGDEPVAALAEEPAGGRTDCNRGGPDVIVGDLLDVSNYAAVGNIEAFAVGTTSCNVGNQNLQWVASTNQHPVIAQNMYRLKNGRFEQVGQSWLKHGFTALTQNICGCGCNGQGGSVLGVGCSDPYCCGLNGDQSDLGPRFEVNPLTGVYNYPFTFINQTGNSIYKRLQVKIDDLDPALNGGGQYFVEGHYITPDDAAAGNQANNASYRTINVTGSGSAWSISLTGATVREAAAIKAWKAWDPAVQELLIKADGHILLSGKATSLGGGMWHYEYAVQNIYSDRAIGSFQVPVGAGTLVTNIGFHDVDYHSGEPYDGTDWPGSYDGNFVTWATTPHSVNPNANALRWGTLYNFRFDANRPPATTTITLGHFKPGTPAVRNALMVGPSVAPQDCNSNGIDDLVDIASGESRDCNDNDVPDECENFPQTPLRTALVASGFSALVHLAAPPDDFSRLFVVEQNTGQIRIIKNGAVLPTPFLNIGSLITVGGERGLLSMAFHPEYASNGHFYVNYTNTSGDTVIARYTVSIDPDIANPTTALILKTIDQDSSNHNGGQLQFGPDGYLYVGMGDGGSFDDPFNRAQDPQSLLGKMLRLDVDAAPPYVPASNPFVGDPGTLDEIWALGLRNPWRFSFDRDTGDLYIGDVGQNSREEVDFQPASSAGGENYGWDCEEGFICTPTNNGGYGCSCGDPGLTSPILDVDHSESCSITGGYVYRGCAIPDLVGTYFFSDYCGGYVRTFRFQEGDAVPPAVSDRTAELQPYVGSIVSFGEDAAGELYFVTLSGNVYKIIADTGPVCGNFIVESGEECDDGNTAPGDGCSDTCQLEATCGNNIIEYGETCDPPDGLTCDAECQEIPCEVELFADDFSTDLGWTVNNTSVTGGAWQRGDPAGLGDRGDPTDDYNGGGQCYLTGNGAGDTDVDGGPTRLISPIIDASTGDVTLHYAYWYTRDDADGVDSLFVHVSVNGGANWVQIAEHLTTANIWRTNSIHLDDFVTPSTTTQIRFSVQDNPNNSVIEAAIDAVRLTIGCPDCNSNGIDDDSEVAAGTSPDCNGNGVPDACDVVDGTSLDCDGGPVGNAAGGAVHFQNICFGCHNVDGSGGIGFPGPNIRNRSRTFIWNKLLDPAAQHPGGLFPQFTQQDFADIEAYLADNGSRGRPDLIPDECEALADCDSNGVSDGCELEAGAQTDLNYNGVPDECVIYLTVPGDGDADCDMDLRDYALLQACYSGNGVTYAPGCGNFDADGDLDLDLDDFLILVPDWSGPADQLEGCELP